MASVTFSEFSVHLLNRHRVLFAPFSAEWNSNERGLTIGLMGRSGIGKTCFVKALVGLPDGDTRCYGSVTVDGLPPGKSRTLGNIGMAFQQPAIVPWLSVRQNIAISDRTKPATVELLLDWLDLSKISDQKAGVCSDGQQKRVSFARSLAHEPNVLILDEPFTGVDIVTKAKILKCIDEHQVFRGKLVVLVTHDAAEIAHLADELWVLGMKEENRVLRREAQRNTSSDWSAQSLEQVAITALT